MAQLQSIRSMQSASRACCPWLIGGVRDWGFAHPAVPAVGRPVPELAPRRAPAGAATGGQAYHGSTLGRPAPRRAGVGPGPPVFP